MGTLILLPALVRLIAWLGERPRPPAGLPAGAFLWDRALAFAVLLLMLLAPILGLLCGWADGLPIRLGPVELAALVARDRALWQASGYFHSGLGFMLLVLNLATLLTAAILSLRCGHGLVRAFPRGHGAFASSVFRRPSMPLRRSAEVHAGDQHDRLVRADSRSARAGGHRQHPEARDGTAHRRLIRVVSSSAQAAMGRG